MAKKKARSPKKAPVKLDLRLHPVTLGAVGDDPDLEVLTRGFPEGPGEDYGVRFRS